MISENISQESDLLLFNRSALQRTLFPKTSYLVIYHGGISEAEFPVSCKSSLKTTRTVKLSENPRHPPFSSSQ